MLSNETKITNICHISVIVDGVDEKHLINPGLHFQSRHMAVFINATHWSAPLTLTKVCSAVGWLKLDWSVSATSHSI